MGAGRDKDEDSVAMLRPIHLEFEELLLCQRQSVALNLAALEINADVARALRFRFLDRFHDAFVIEFLEKFLGAHFEVTSLRSNRLRQNFRPRR